MANNKPKILVVEDEGIVAKDIENTLKKLDYHIVDVVASGEDAIKSAELKKPDLILMDIRLNGAIDGITAANEIKKWLDVPVIYLTAYSDDETLRRAKITEPSGYLLKPFDEKELHVVVETALFRHKIYQETKYLKEFNEKIVEGIPLGIIVVDQNRVITGINKAQEELFGQARGDVVGRRVYEDYLQSMDDVITPILQKALSKGAMTYSLGVDYTNEAAKKHRLFDIFVSPLGAEGSVTGAIIITKDVTKEKRLEQRIQVLEKKDISISDNEKRVLYALIKYPDLSDQEVSSKVSVNRSTFTGIKNKLMKEGVYQTVRIPNIPMLGFEMLTVGYGSLAGTGKEVLETMIKEAYEKPEFVYGITTDSEFIYFVASRDFTSYRRVFDPLEEKYLPQNHASPFMTAQFPFPRTDTAKVCDYSQLLGERLKIEMQDAPETPFFGETGNVKLSENEAKVLYGLTKYPTLPDNEIASRISLNKITLSQIKKRLYEDNLIRTFVIPDQSKLGCEIFVLVHGLFAPSKRMLENKDLLGLLPKPIVHVESKREFVGLFPFRDFMEYKPQWDRFMKEQMRVGLFRGEPKVLVLPLKKVLAVKAPDFAPLIKERYCLKL